MCEDAKSQLHTPLLHTVSLNKMKPYNTSLTSCTLPAPTQRACHVDGSEERMAALFDIMQTMFILLPCSYVWHLLKLCTNPTSRAQPLRQRKKQTLSSNLVIAFNVCIQRISSNIA